MEDLLRNLDSHPKVTVSITTGTEFFRKGLVKLSVRGDGHLTILNRRSGKAHELTAELTAAQTGGFGRALTDAGFTTLRSPGEPREPGDSPVILELHQDGAEIYRGELWYGDRYKMPGVDTIIKVYDEIVTKHSNGDLPY